MYDIGFISVLNVSERDIAVTLKSFPFQCLLSCYSGMTNSRDKRQSGGVATKGRGDSSRDPLGGITEARRRRTEGGTRARPRLVLPISRGAPGERGAVAAQGPPQLSGRW